MKRKGFFSRFRWSIVIVVIAAALWYPAFCYLVDFRQPDVMFVTTPHDVVAAMLDLAEVTEEDTVYDMGAGDGRIVIAAARDHGARAVGVEIDPKLAAEAQEAIRAAGVQGRARVHRGDMFKENLAPATVVTMFLKPLVNVQLRPQLDRLRPGARIVSHMFSMPGARPKKVVEYKAKSGVPHRLYLWVTPIEWEEPEGEKTSP
jgi:precorrin-6B methylase 2